MHVGISDDPEAMAAATKRDEPHPVPSAHQMHRAAPSQAGHDTGSPLGIVGPVVDFHSGVDTPPGGIGAVLAALDQAQPPLEQAGASARVDDPSCRKDADTIRRRDRHGMDAPRIQREVVDPAAV
jgi:hypothetical protein